MKIALFLALLIASFVFASTEGESGDTTSPSDTTGAVDVEKPVEPTKDTETEVKPAEPTKDTETEVKPAEPTKDTETEVKPAEESELGAILDKLIGSIVAKLDDLLNALKKEVSGGKTGSEITKEILNLVKPLEMKLKELLTGVNSDLDKLLQTLGETLKDLEKKISEGATAQDLLNVVNKLVKDVTNLLNGVTKVLGEKSQDMADDIKKSSILQEVTNLLNGVLSNVTKLVEDLLGNILGLPKVILGSVKDTIATVDQEVKNGKDKGTKLIGSVTTGTKQIVGGVTQGLGTILGGLGGLLGKK